jgi:hypothetical protein
MTKPIDIEHDAETEDYEEIPWSHLVEELGRPRHHVPLLVAGVLVVGALGGFLVARVVVDGPPAAAESVTSTTAAASATTPPDPAGEPTTARPTASSPPTTLMPEVVFSEADLMAVAGDHEVTTAAARAEWFVREYFTVDGTGEPSDQLTDVLTAMDIARPVGTTSYVEWARTMIVEPTSPGTYDVTVVFQMLVAEAETFVRHPARSVRVRVAVDGSLASAVTGLPRPAPLDTAQALELPGPEAMPPSHILEEATLQALRFGSSPTVERSWFGRGTWHIVMSVQLGGAAWPLLVDVPEPGSRP